MKYKHKMRKSVLQHKTVNNSYKIKIILNINIEIKIQLNVLIAVLILNLLMKII